MAYATSYTTETLAEWMQSELGDYAKVLGWTTATQYQRAIDRTLERIEADVPESASDVTLLLAWSRVEVWRAARQASATFTRITLPDGRSIDRKQLRDNADAEVNDALKEIEALRETAAGATYAPQALHIHHVRDNSDNPFYRPHRRHPWS